MKHLNDTHKKWLLTASLASLLSFNLVMTLVSSPVYTADFASESGTVVTKKGPLNVKFSASDDGKGTKAVYEAGNCSTGACAERSVMLKVPFNKENMSEILYLAQVNALESEGSAKAETKAKADKDEEETKETARERRERLKEEREEAKAEKERKREEKEEAKELAREEKAEKEAEEKEAREEKGNERLAKLEKRCAREIDIESRMDCFGNGLSRLLSGSKRSAKPSDTETTKTWQSNLRGDVVNALLGRAGEKAKQDAIGLMSLLSTPSIAKAYPTLKKAVVLTATQTIVTENATLQQWANSHKTKGGRYNPAIKAQYDDAMNRIAADKAALGNIVGAGAVSEAEASFMKVAYENPTAKIEESMKQFKPYPTLNPTISLENMASYQVPVPAEASTATSSDDLGQKSKDLKRMELKTITPGSDCKNGICVAKNGLSENNPGSNVVIQNPNAPNTMTITELPGSPGAQGNRAVRPGANILPPGVSAVPQRGLIRN